MSPADAWALLARAPALYLAADGPLLKVVHPVVVDGLVAFHGAPVGEKTAALGGPVVASVHEVVAEIPSHFTDPEKACPATTFYRAVQVDGVLEVVDDPGTKARVLQALMRKFQPGGGHAPIDPAHPDYARLYDKAVRGLLVAAIRPARISGKAKLGQNKRPAVLSQVVEGLWQRGAPGDLAAIDAIRDANAGVGPPRALREAPDGVSLALGRPEDAAACAALLDGQYWVTDDRARVAASLCRSSAWVVAHAAGQVVGSAAALTDGVRRGTVADVVVEPEWRGRGVASAMLRALLDHPAARDCTLGLGTRDAMALYHRFGFIEADTRVMRRVAPR